MLTMSSALDRCRRYYANNPAVVDAEGQWTWTEHLDRVARLAGALQALGVKRGDAFATLSRNTFRNFELLHAGYWMGAVPAPVNIRLAAPEIAYILDNAGADVVAVDAPFLGLLDHEALAPWRDRAIRVAGPGEAAAGADHTGSEWAKHDYEALIAGADPAALHDAGEEDTAILFYTGGTTGRSKGVPLSHRNAVSNGMQVGHTVGVYSEDVYLHVAPMFHSADLLGTGFTLMGSGHAFLPAFTPANLLGAIQDRGVTWTMLAPTMIIMTLQQEDLTQYDLSSLRAFLYGSAPMAAEWVERTLKAFDGVGLIQGYGLTETSPILTLMSHREHVQAIETGNRDRLKAAGRPIVGVDMRIVGDDGSEMPNGQSGEVVVRAPNVTAGYLNLPEENARGLPRRLVPHRRCRPDGRRRLHVSGRPQEGHDHHRQRKRLFARGRGRALPASGGRRMRGDRHSGQQIRRSPVCRRRAAAGAERERGGTGCPLPEADRRLQDSAPIRLPVRVAEKRDGQDPQNRPARDLQRPGGQAGGRGAVGAVLRDGASRRSAAHCSSAPPQDEGLYCSTLSASS